jgi:hypothetical protein
LEPGERITRCQKSAAFWASSSPYFHAKYGGDVGIFPIAGLKLIEGHLPHRVIALTLEWAFEHRPELQGYWELALQGKPLRKIPPLV